MLGRLFVRRSAAAPEGSAEVDARDPVVAGLPSGVRRYLLPTERLVVAVRRHPAQLLEPFASVVAAFVVVVWLTFRLPPQVPLVGDALFLGWFVLLARAGWRLLMWHGDWFVATDRRLLLTFGVVNRRVAMMPVGKVTDMSYNQTLAGRVLDYGEFVMESAGQDQALREVRWLPVPDQLYISICAEIFGADRVPPVVPGTPRGRRRR